MKSLVMTAIALAVATGCVSSSKHEKLQKKYKDAVESRDAKIETLEKEVERLETEVATLAQEKKELEAKRDELQEELTSVVKDKARLKASADELKKAVAELQTRQDQATKRLNQLKDLLAKFKSLIDAGKLKIKIAHGRMVLVLPSDVLFASGSADIGEEGVMAIVEIANVLKTLKDRQFQIEGHTDNVPIKTRRFKSNWDLAAARAITVVKTMVDAGVAPEMLSAASFGDIRPANSNDTDEGKAGNRRIEIVLVPDLSQLPGFDELNKAVK